MFLFSEKKQSKKDLSHELKHLTQVIKRLNDECNKLMVEKFGKLVHMEKLEGAVVNLQIEELRQRLDDAGDEFYNSMVQYEVSRRTTTTSVSDVTFNGMCYGKMRTYRVHGHSRRDYLCTFSFWQ